MNNPRTYQTDKRNIHFKDDLVFKDSIVYVSEDGKNLYGPLSYTQMALLFEETLQELERCRLPVKPEYTAAQSEFLSAWQAANDGGLEINATSFGLECFLNTPLEDLRSMLKWCKAAMVRPCTTKNAHNQTKTMREALEASINLKEHGTDGMKAAIDFFKKYKNDPQMRTPTAFAEDYFKKCALKDIINMLQTSQQACANMHLDELVFHNDTYKYKHNAMKAYISALKAVKKARTALVQAPLPTNKNTVRAFTLVLHRPRRS